MGEQLRLNLDEPIIGARIDLTPEEIAIWKEIKGRSREDAIRIRDLAERLKMDERSMRQSINQLRLMHYPIGSSSNPPPGYFEIMTVKDMEETCRMFRKRALNELYVWSRLIRYSMPDLLHQLKLELKSDAEK